MIDALRASILDFLRVPPEPEVPDGTTGAVRIFRAGRNFYRWQVLAWAASHFGVLLLVAMMYFVLTRATRRGPDWVQFAAAAVGVLLLLAAAIVLPVTYLALKWSFELRWYIVTDRSLRIRRGVWLVEELTMTFANIQEIRVAADPLQNLLGISDVEVHSAGGGTVGPHGHRSGHKASFEGVENGSEIRDHIVERLRAYRDLGLGGIDHHQPEAPAAQSVDAIVAARAVLEEAKALRHLLERSAS